MRAVFGLTALDSGTVRFDGRPIDFAERRRFGYLPEERGLYPTMKVLDQLVFLGELRGLARAEAAARAARWLGDLGLAERTGDKIEELSLGNQQRIQLIGALLHEPDVLVLDEPFSGLDPVAVDALSKVLVGRGPARRHRAVLVPPARPRRGPVRASCRGRPWSGRRRGHDRRPHRGRRPGAGGRGGRRSRRRRGVARSADAQVLGVKAGRVRLALGPGAGSAPERAQPVLDAARRAGPVTRFGFERRSLAEVFLAAVGRPVDDGTDDG